MRSYPTWSASARIFSRSSANLSSCKGQRSQRPPGSQYWRGFPGGPKFRGICRGLIEAEKSHAVLPYRLLKFRGICRGLIEAVALVDPNGNLAAPKFRGICRGLIEARIAA